MITVKEFYSLIFSNSNCHLTKATILTYKTNLRRTLLKMYGDIAVQDVTPAMIDRIYSTQSANLKANSIGGIRAAIQYYFRKAIEHGIILVDPSTRKVDRQYSIFMQETDYYVFNKYIMPTFKEYFRHYLDVGTLTDRSKNSYLLQMSAHVFPTIGDMPLDQITSNHITNIIEVMRRTTEIKEDSIKETYRIIKRVFTIAVREKAILHNPCAVMYAWNKDPEYRFPESLEQHNLLVDSLEQLPLRNLYGFCYFTGISMRKAVTIKVSTVNVIDHTLFLNGSPNEGVLYLSDQAFSYVYSAKSHHDRLQAPENDLLFVKEDGSHINITDIEVCTHILRSL